MKQLHFKTPQAWRDWLHENHDREREGVWLIFFKKGTGKASVDYNAAVEEALCYGWIDSIIKKLDDEKYARKFTPRKHDSKWSELNKKRVEKLIKQNRMARQGWQRSRLQSRADCGISPTGRRSASSCRRNSNRRWRKTHKPASSSTTLHRLTRSNTSPGSQSRNVRKPGRIASANR